MHRQKRIATIQDISCFGKCSLTVALPIISAMDIECTVIPTAVLSAHTGCFNDYTMHDLTDDIEKIAVHWKKNGINLDGIYSGYISSTVQADIICRIIDDFRPALPQSADEKNDFLVFADPAMADNGKLYAGFGNEIISAMQRICKKADVIVPNLTEASFLLGEEYRSAENYSIEQIKDMLYRLTDNGAKAAAITGIRRGNTQGVISFSRESGEFAEYFAENLPAKLPGTGDVFSSVMFASLVRGKTMYESIRLAVEFTLSCIRATIGDSSHWYGVRFESCLPMLIRGTEEQGND